MPAYVIPDLGEELLSEHYFHGVGTANPACQRTNICCAANTSTPFQQANCCIRPMADVCCNRTDHPHLNCFQASLLSTIGESRVPRHDIYRW